MSTGEVPDSQALTTPCRLNDNALYSLTAREMAFTVRQLRAG